MLIEFMNTNNDRQQQQHYRDRGGGRSSGALHAALPLLFLGGFLGTQNDMNNSAQMSGILGNNIKNNTLKSQKINSSNKSNQPNKPDLYAISISGFLIVGDGISGN